jgi:hypothetical protein
VRSIYFLKLKIVVNNINDIIVTDHKTELGTLNALTSKPELCTFMIENAADELVLEVMCMELKEPFKLLTVPVIDKSANLLYKGFIAAYELASVLTKP